MTTWNLNIPVQVNERDRRAVAAFYGDKGMATLRDCRAFIRNNGIVALCELPDPADPEPEWEHGTFGSWPKEDADAP